MPYRYENTYDKCFIDGQYANRFAIEDDTPIRGGVSFGMYRGEAIVVNPENPSARKHYEAWFTDSVARASLHGVVQRSKVLLGVYETVAEKMDYDEVGVQDIVQERYGQKIDLSVFMEKGVGVCRHQALAVAALLEMHKDTGAIRGMPRVNRNIRVDEYGHRGGHAWARYTAQNGAVSILDVAQYYAGSLDRSVAEMRLGRRWDYRNDSDKQ